MTDLEIIEQLNNSPLIKKKYLDNSIVSYNFTREAFYKQEWNDLTCRARGLFIDSETNKIVARSYDKFFNDSQLSYEQLKKFEHPFEVSFKENGYLGLLSYNFKTDDFFITTKSVDYGDYKDWFKQILEQNNYLTDVLKNFLATNNVTMVFEVIDPEHDSHIIEYDKKEVILLDIVENSFVFKPKEYDFVENIAKTFKFKHKQLCLQASQTDIDFLLMFLNLSLGDKEVKIEGLVVRDCKNRMFKIKSYYYIYWKTIRNYLQRIINNKLNLEDIDKMKELEEVKNILRYAFDNYYSDMSLIEFRKEYESRKN